mmetsp:Transcript_6885/g.21497  ORF Transcript_6885/g.21497 Transcript_6885/m.21497 type:complete len:327 (-) Transcript_6885:135-1115(-)
MSTVLPSRCSGLQWRTPRLTLSSSERLVPHAWSASCGQHPWQHGVPWSSSASVGSGQVDHPASDMQHRCGVLPTAGASQRRPPPAGRRPLAQPCHPAKSRQRHPLVAKMPCRSRCHRRSQCRHQLRSRAPLRRRGSDIRSPRAWWVWWVCQHGFQQCLRAQTCSRRPWQSYRRPCHRPPRPQTPAQLRWRPLHLHLLHQRLPSRLPRCPLPRLRRRPQPPFHQHPLQFPLPRLLPPLQPPPPLHPWSLASGLARACLARMRLGVRHRCRRPWAHPWLCWAARRSCRRSSRDVKSACSLIEGGGPGSFDPVRKVGMRSETCRVGRRQ